MRTCLVVVMAVLLTFALVAAIPFMMVNLMLSEQLVVDIVQAADIPGQFSALVVSQLETMAGGSAEEQIALLLLRELDPGSFVEQALTDNLVPLLRYLKGQGDLPAFILDFSSLKLDLLSRLSDPAALIELLEQNYPGEVGELRQLLENPEFMDKMTAELETTIGAELPDTISLWDAVGEDGAGVREALHGTRQLVVLFLNLSRIGLVALVVMVILTILAGWLRSGLIGTGIAFVVAGFITGLLGLLPRLMMGAVINSLASQDISLEMTGLVVGPLATLLSWPLYAAGAYLGLGVVLIVIGALIRPKTPVMQVAPGQETVVSGGGTN